MRTSIFATMLFASILFAGCASTSTSVEEEQLARQETVKAVLYRIYVEVDMESTGRVVVSGSGTAISPDGYVVFNAHLFDYFDGAKPVICLRFRGYNGCLQHRILLVDRSNDLVLARLQAPPAFARSLQFVVTGSSEKLKALDQVYGYCRKFYPDGFFEAEFLKKKARVFVFSESSSIANSKHELLNLLEFYLGKSVSSCSGSAVVNSRGEFIGLIVSESKDLGLFYAIDAKTVERVTEEVIRLDRESQKNIK